jgi:hypothetical protein
VRRLITNKEWVHSVIIKFPKRRYYGINTNAVYRGTTLICMMCKFELVHMRITIVLVKVVFRRVESFKNETMNSD